ncbi:hypothetical protein GQ43DRAFT_476713 [Delitschia confertaspora ATCC 74209]|uniref:Uncharacterized protein n=1 Tax=Delitschia confertaspora ATCC 74209 TaxID=1513339 RepID=A0A9P4JEW4_9PLEO|nr:hypothetical protein GQ43DRAFT_476713 [Delitschia confertaspora ATCC 74209]
MPPHTASVVIARAKAGLDPFVHLEAVVGVGPKGSIDEDGIPNHTEFQLAGYRFNGRNGTLNLKASIWPAKGKLQLNSELDVVCQYCKTDQTYLRAEYGESASEMESRRYENADILHKHVHEWHIAGPDNEGGYTHPNVELNHIIINNHGFGHIVPTYESLGPAVPRQQLYAAIKFGMIARFPYNVELNNAREKGKMDNKSFHERMQHDLMTRSAYLDYRKPKRMTPEQRKKLKQRKSARNRRVRGLPPVFKEPEDVGMKDAADGTLYNDIHPTSTIHQAICDTADGNIFTLADALAKFHENGVIPGLANAAVDDGTNDATDVFDVNDHTNALIEGGINDSAINVTVDTVVDSANNITDVVMADAAVDALFNDVTNAVFTAIPNITVKESTGIMNPASETSSTTLDININKSAALVNSAPVHSRPEEHIFGVTRPTFHRGNHNIPRPAFEYTGIQSGNFYSGEHMLLPGTDGGSTPMRGTFTGYGDTLMRGYQIPTITSPARHYISTNTNPQGNAQNLSHGRNYYESIC